MKLLKTVPQIVIILTLITLFSSCKKEEKKIELWYTTPASRWEEALPIGNGRLGAMIYGTTAEEHIQFNEETLWDCQPREYQRNDAWKHLAEIRHLLFEGKQKEAETLASQYAMGSKEYETDFVKNRTHWRDSILMLETVTNAIKPEFDASGWETMLIDFKSVWEKNGLPDLDGSLLFIKNVSIPKSWKNRPVTFHLGRLKDEDFTYINGQLIGSSYDENGNRTYTIPKGVLKPGDNKIAVLINNYISTGGFNGVRKPPYKMYLQPQGLTTDTLTVEGEWRYKVIDTKPPLYPQYQAKYQPFGDVKIKFANHDSVTNYRRSLDLTEALAHVSYSINGTTFQREYLASHPDNAIAINLTASEKGAISFKTYFTTLHPISKTKKIDANTIALTLKVEGGAMRGCAYLTVTTKNGSVTTTNGVLEVQNADEATLKLMANTNYVAYNNITAKPEEKCIATNSQLSERTYEAIKKDHLTDYKTIFNRFAIDLGQTENRAIPTDKRIALSKERADNDLSALYVQYGRYLMISSGREGTNPPNLQGIWNDKIHPAWGSKYTLNINCEMNFWPVEPLNMSECHNSLFGMIEELAITGEKTAKEHYNARGWVAHHNTDQWRGAAPINASNHGIWVTGGAWLCQHLWEHYNFTQDTTFLREKAYPLMKGAAEFFVDFLVKDPRTGYLVSSPSNSPEHGGLVVGPEMDHQIIRALYSNVIKSCELLHIDTDFADTLRVQLKQIAPSKIGKHGQLQEWQEDIDKTDDTHRHVSHLWAVHPDNSINWDETPKLMEAAKQSLVYRGDDGTGWSLAWKINFWARFRDGDHAHKMIQMLFRDAFDAESSSGGGGSYPNLFDAHPPFQIDGNFGGAAGIAEMLLQSQGDYIELLPALPNAWPNGQIKGLCARGGFVVDMRWNYGKLTSTTITSKAGLPLTLKYNGKTIQQKTTKGEVITLDKW